MYFVLLYGGKNQFPCKYAYGLPIYRYVAESLSNSPKKIIVITNEETKYIPFSLSKMFPEHEWHQTILPFNTRGAAESVFQGLSAFFKENDTIEKDEPFWILDNDVVYDPETPWEMLGTQLVLLGKPIALNAANTPNGYSAYSHIITDERDPNRVTNVIEKENKSPLVLMGGYGIPSFNLFVSMYNSMLKTFNNQDYFMSEIVRYALRSTTRVEVCRVAQTYTVGSAAQIKEAMECGVLFPRPLRWVFDLDDTLVSQPRVLGDYTTAVPIAPICDFLRYLKTNKHYIIIYTARHMKTCNGNIKLIEERVGGLTRDYLKKHNIPYDELVFGKPYADVYIDDKAFHPFGIFPEKNVLNCGIDEMFLKSVKGKIHKVGDELCYKYDTCQNIAGYTYYVAQAPKAIKAFLPHLYSQQSDRILMKWIDGITVGQLYANNVLEKRIFERVLDLIGVLHAQITDEPPINAEMVMENYWPKLEKRINENESQYSKLNVITPAQYSHKIKQFFEHYSPQVASCIHGDFWFSNLIWNHREQKLYMIDMRGRLGDKPCLGGDILYDLAKLYQSIVGFDFLIQKGSLPPKEYQKIYENMFVDYLNKVGISFQDVKRITFTLMYGSLPFHKEINANPRVLRLYEGLLRSLW